ncbi:MAG: hypothetical protein ACK5L7_07765 [Paludibacteraceae bacterium]
MKKIPLYIILVLYSVPIFAQQQSFSAPQEANVKQEEMDSNCCPDLYSPQKATTMEEAMEYGDSVRYLDVSFQTPKLTAIPKEVGLLSSLMCLDVSYNRVAGIPREILNCTKLVCIDLTGNQYLQDLPNFLNEMPTLKIIRLKDLQFFTSIKKEILKKKFPNIKLEFD